jgi:hypothetical protein
MFGSLFTGKPVQLLESLNGIIFNVALVDRSIDRSVAVWNQEVSVDRI